MIWTKTNDRHISGDYEIFSETRGYSAWIYSDTQSACLGHEIANLETAKRICEAHSFRASRPGEAA